MGNACPDERLLDFFGNISLFTQDKGLENPGTGGTRFPFEKKTDAVPPALNPKEERIMKSFSDSDTDALLREEGNGINLAKGEMALIGKDPRIAKSPG